jgi:polysaccharide deacetylase family protein (PEP-CTERM system associated)
MVMRNVLTVDVEEWFHVCGVPSLSASHWPQLPSRVESTTTLLLDELDAAGVTGMFFVLGWVAERCPGLVRAIAARGHEIGTHGYWHRRSYELTPAEFTADVRASLRAIGAAGVTTVEAFRAPEWSINGRSTWALDELVRCGLRIDASMAPVRMVGDVSFRRDPHVRRTAAGPIVEVPPFVADRFGQVMPIGWGWALRMTSPARVLREIDRANQRGRAAVLTVHPWEIDPAPPRVALPPALRFAHYFRLDGFLGRLRTVLRGTAFGPLRTLAAGVSES